MREDFVRGLKIVAGTFATSVPAYFLAQLLFTRELAMAVGFAAALGTSSALQAQTRPGGAFGWRRHLLLGVIVTACLTPLYGFCSDHRLARQLPNKRLTLTGGDRCKGSGVLCAGAHELSFNSAVPRGRVARSLSAIR